MCGHFSVLVSLGDCNNVEHIFILHYLSIFLHMSADVLVLVIQIVLIKVFAGNFPYAQAMLHVSHSLELNGKRTVLLYNLPLILPPFLSAPL